MTPFIVYGARCSVANMGSTLQMAYGRTPFADLNLYQKLKCITDESYEIPYPPARAVDPCLLDTIHR